MVFVDTGVLVYATAHASPFHTVALTALADLEQTDGELWISRQILRECLAVVTRPQSFAQPMTGAEAARRARSWSNRYHVADDTEDVSDRLFELVDQVAVGGKQIHDTNIVATMLVLGIDQLVTPNEIDFARYAPRIVVLPLSQWASAGPPAATGCR